MANQVPDSALAPERAIDAARNLSGRLHELGDAPIRETRVTLFERSLVVAVTGRAVLELLPAVSAATAAGHTCRLELETESDGFEVTWRRDRDPDMDGNLEFLLDPGDKNRLRRFMDAGDVAASLQLLEDHAFILRASLSFNGSGSAWIPSADVLVTALSTGAWLSTLMQLSQFSLGGHAVLIVDGLDSTVHTPLFTFSGSDIAPDGPRPDTTDDGEGLASQFLSARRQRGWPEMPSPHDVAPTVSPRPAVATRLASALTSASHVLAWAWLSAEMPVLMPSSVRVKYRGVKDVELDLVPSPDVDAVEASRSVNLWEWVAAAGDDPLRIDAAQRAISLAVTTPDDLHSASGPALRTAQTLHELATRGAVAEALAARRAGRDAAATAARTAATAARETAGKATERSLALTAAAAAVVFATLQKALDWWVSSIALSALALLLLGSLAVSRLVDLTGADRTLDSFGEDVAAYRESLSEDDLQQIREMAILRSARTDISRSRTVSTSVYLVAACIAIVLAIVFALQHPTR